MKASRFQSIGKEEEGVSCNALSLFLQGRDLANLEQEKDDLRCPSSFHLGKVLYNDVTLQLRFRSEPVKRNYRKTYKHEKEKAF